MSEDALNKLAVGFALAELLEILERKARALSSLPDNSVAVYFQPEEWERLTRSLGAIRAGLGG